MSTFNDVVLQWTEDRLDALLATPEMWGSKEAVEMQALLLFELQALSLRPDDTLAAPGDVFQAYTRFLRDRFPQRAPAPLCELPGDSFEETLSEFRHLLKARLLSGGSLNGSVIDDEDERANHPRPGRLPRQADDPGAPLPRRDDHRAA